jgi:flavoprotein
MAKKPKFYQAILKPIKGNVLEHVYPLINQNGKISMTMTERMGSEEAKCSDCGKNVWMLLPNECSAVREGGKAYIECLNCGLITHL